MSCGNILAGVSEHLLIENLTDADVSRRWAAQVGASLGMGQSSQMIDDALKRLPDYGAPVWCRMDNESQLLPLKPMTVEVASLLGQATCRIPAMVDLRVVSLELTEPDPYPVGQVTSRRPNS